MEIPMSESKLQCWNRNSGFEIEIKIKIEIPMSSRVNDLNLYRNRNFRKSKH
jgi:hypothetical protein